MLGHVGSIENHYGMMIREPRVESRRFFLKKTGLRLVPLWYSGMPVTILYLMICRWLDDTRCMCCIYWNWESSVPMSNYRRVLQGTPGDAASLGPSPRERRSAWHQRRATKAHVHCDGTGLGPWNPMGSSEIPWEIIHEGCSIATGLPSGELSHFAMV